MLRDAGVWNSLLAKPGFAVTGYLNAQIDAGAQMVQVFDSWVGCLGPTTTAAACCPTLGQFLKACGPRAGNPFRHRQSGPPAAAPGGRQRRDRDRLGECLDDAWRTVGHDKAVQGNLDPAVLLTGVAEIRRRVQDILETAGGRPGHIFNLGHGVYKDTPVENAVALVEAVKEPSRRRQAVTLTQE